MQKATAPLLHPTGETFSRVFAWGAAEPSLVTVVEPFAVEVTADASAEDGNLRHNPRLLRARPGLDPEDLML
ncbi:MAG: hypothetical protein ABR571_13510 [Jatrophihabitans sp.]|uniref:hypothetical protein n=1 Tax=Jatrophihabitans sp. TaxID=1932789 RepID=UPI0039116802